MNRLIAFLIAATGIGVGAYFYLSEKSKDNAPEAGGPPNAVKPPGTTGNAPEATNTEEAKYYSLEAGEGAEAIRNRMNELFRYRDSRNKILERYGVLDPIFQGITYISGTNAVINTLFGNVFNLPIYPKSIFPDYYAQLQAIQATEGFEKITSTAGIDSAFSTWRNALNFPTGETLWLENVMEILKTGAFGPHGKADKNWSERYDAYTGDMQKLAKNMAKASTSLEDALRQQAISDLRGAGWKFTGID